MRLHCCDLGTRVSIGGLFRRLTLPSCSLAAWREAVFLWSRWCFVLCWDLFLCGFLNGLHLECRELQEIQVHKLSEDSLIAFFGWMKFASIGNVGWGFNVFFGEF